MFADLGATYDLEYAELLAVDWRPDKEEVELRLRLPLARWRTNAAIATFIRAFRPTKRNQPTIEHLVTLTFRGVNDVRETLISRGHEVTGADPSTDWARKIIFEIDEITIDDLRHRFCLNAEGLVLGFKFHEYRLSSEPVPRTPGGGISLLL